MNKALNKLSTLLDENRHASIYVSLLTILLSLLCASVILLILGKNPLVAFESFLQGAGFWPKANYGGGTGMLTDLFSFLNVLAPMILAALSFVVGFKAGLFNIGISGQMLAAGFLATSLVGYSGLSAVLAKPLVILIGIAAGGLLGAFVGFLKYKFNIHEVVSTIMINYIVNYLTGFFINTYYADMLTRSMKICGSNARLTWTGVQLAGVKCDIPLGIVLAVVAAFAVKFIFDKTVFGFELQSVGMNAKCARYTGIKVGNRIIAAMVISGMLAGLAGVTYYCGYYNTIVPKTLPDLGYDAIAVALLGNSSPIGCIFAGILISIFQTGSNYMSSTLGVAKEIASLITGILLLFSACGGFFRYMARRRLDRVADENAQAGAATAAGEDENAQAGTAATASGVTEDDGQPAQPGGDAAGEAGCVRDGDDGAAVTPSTDGDSGGRMRSDSGGPNEAPNVSQSERQAAASNVAEEDGQPAQPDVAADTQPQAEAADAETTDSIATDLKKADSETGKEVGPHAG